MIRVERQKLIYPIETQERVKNVARAILRGRYLGNPRVRRVWLSGSLIRGEFGAYLEPYTDTDGMLQEGSDVDAAMVVDTTGILEDDYCLHKYLGIRYRKGASCYILTENDRDFFFKGQHPRTGKTISHPFHVVAVMASYFDEMMQGLHDEGLAAKGIRPFKGFDPDRSSLALKIK